MNGKRTRLPWEVCVTTGRIAQKSAKVILVPERAANQRMVKAEASQTDEGLHVRIGHDADGSVSSPLTTEPHK